MQQNWSIRCWGHPLNFYRWDCTICNNFIFFAENIVLVPNKTEDSTFVYTLVNATVFHIIKRSNITDYVTANQSCQAKGGHLAVIDTVLKQNIIQNLTIQHMRNFTMQKGVYLIGTFIWDLLRLFHKWGPDFFWIVHNSHLKM